MLRSLTIWNLKSKLTKKNRGNAATLFITKNSYSHPGINWFEKKFSNIRMIQFKNKNWIFCKRICEDLLLISRCMQICNAYWMGVVFSYKHWVADSRQLHLHSACALNASESCGVIQALKAVESLMEQWWSFLYDWLLDLASWEPWAQS